MSKMSIAVIWVVLAVTSLLPLAENAPRNLRKKSRASGPDPASKVAAAINAKNPRKAATFYTEEATLLPADQPMVRGRAKVEQFVQGWLAEGVSDVVILPLKIETFGNDGYEVANFELSAGSAAQKVRVKGKLIALLERGSDGQWRMAYEAWNSNPPEH